jgi:hypothetical protein
MTKAQSVQKKYYDKRHKPLTFAENDKVLLRTHFQSKKIDGFSKKLALRWDGPYSVVKQTSPVNYQIMKMTPGSQPKVLSDYFSDNPNQSNQLIKTNQSVQVHVPNVIQNPPHYTLRSRQK